jgi:uncharacterized damage-inducible protein DinB
VSAVPYSHELAGRDPLEVIAETPARLARVLEALTPEQIETRPAPGKWNVREIVAHLADCEIAWSWRLRQIYGEDHPTIQPFDQDSWARCYDAYTYAAARKAFEAMRAWNVEFVRGLSAEDKRRPVTHPERGEETLWTIVEIMAGHDLHHLIRLEALLAA